ncbi:sialin-like [Babylonia areolata]|uniref:sialin-like n=1 Tax=Babylonia areolata TaxID=304850 RepID=UPI003FD1D8B8
MTKETMAPQPAKTSPPDKTHTKRRITEMKYFSRRWVLAYLLCMARFCQASVRQCMGIALVCMTGSGQDDVTANTSSSLVNTSSYDNMTSSVFINTTTASRPPRLRAGGGGGGGEFRWSVTLEGHVLGSYYYGFVVSVMLAGYVDHWLGSVRTIALGMAGSGGVCLLTPALTRQHPYLLVALRALAGYANGLIDPAVLTLWSHWAPAPERGQLSAVEYSGLSVGGMLTFLVSALLCQVPVDNGWPFVFYFYGCQNLMLAALWCYLARDSPEAHPAVTDGELSYILAHRSGLRSAVKASPPWLSILTSGAVWAILLTHVSVFWVYAWILAYLPMYMDNVLHYDIAQNGALSSLPFVGKLVMGIAGGYLADMMMRKRLSIVCVRKTFQIVGSVGCAVPLLVISFLSHEERVVAVALLVVSVSLENLGSVAYRINSLDIAPRYAGFLMSMTSTVASAVTLTAPYVTSALLGNKTREEWQRVLYIVAGVSTTGGVVFLLCARGHVQDWARDTGLEVEVGSLPPEELPLGGKKDPPLREDGAVSEHLLPTGEGSEERATTNGSVLLPPEKT